MEGIAPGQLVGVTGGDVKGWLAALRLMGQYRALAGRLEPQIAAVERVGGRLAAPLLERHAGFQREAEFWAATATRRLLRSPRG